jgi:osmotically inducible lipoprotein OsmB
LPPTIVNVTKEDDMVRSIIVLAVAGFVLAGCGTSTGDRGLSGAGLGAATGAVVGAMVGAPLAGAAIGAGAGATVGAVTSPSAIDLGKPVWEQ